MFRPVAISYWQMNWRNNVLTLVNHCHRIWNIKPGPNLNSSRKPSPFRPERVESAICTGLTCAEGIRALLACSMRDHCGYRSDLLPHSPKLRSIRMSVCRWVFMLVDYANPFLLGSRFSFATSFVVCKGYAFLHICWFLFSMKRDNYINLWFAGQSCRYGE